MFVNPKKVLNRTWAAIGFHGEKLPTTRQSTLPCFGLPDIRSMRPWSNVFCLESPGHRGACRALADASAPPRPLSYEFRRRINGIQLRYCLAILFVMIPTITIRIALSIVIATL